MHVIDLQSLVKMSSAITPLYMFVIILFLFVVFVCFYTFTLASKPNSLNWLQLFFSSVL